VFVLFEGLDRAPAMRDWAAFLPASSHASGVVRKRLCDRNWDLENGGH